jgi:hypothetical protein
MGAKNKRKGKETEKKRNNHPFSQSVRKTLTNNFTAITKNEQETKLEKRNQRKNKPLYLKNRMSTFQFLKPSAASQPPIIPYQRMTSYQVPEQLQPSKPEHSSTSASYTKLRSNPFQVTSIVTKDNNAFSFLKCQRFRKPLIPKLICRAQRVDSY